MVMAIGKQAVSCNRTTKHIAFSMRVSKVRLLVLRKETYDKLCRKCQQTAMEFEKTSSTTYESRSSEPFYR